MLLRWCVFLVIVSVTGGRNLYMQENAVLVKLALQCLVGNLVCRLSSILQRNIGPSFIRYNKSQSYNEMECLCLCSYLIS